MVLAQRLIITFVNRKLKNIRRKVPIILTTTVSMYTLHDLKATAEKVKEIVAVL
jgi:hypothetical protein